MQTLYHWIYDQNTSITKLSKFGKCLGAIMKYSTTSTLKKQLTTAITVIIQDNLDLDVVRTKVHNSTDLVEFYNQPQSILHILYVLQSFQAAFNLDLYDGIVITHSGLNLLSISTPKNNRVFVYILTSMNTTIASTNKNKIKQKEHMI